MIFILLAVMIGMALPIQTCINTRLKDRIGTSFSASLVSFFIGTVFLIGLTLAVSHNMYIPFQYLRGQPFWIWRLAGIGTGMLSASQTAVNGYLGKMIGSSLKASVISNTIGTICLLLINLLYHKDIHFKNTACRKYPWWIWFGGPIGGLLIFGNAALSGILGVGVTVVATLIGISAGGVIVDQFGLFGTRRTPVTPLKIIGLAVMVAGGVLIHIM